MVLLDLRGERITIKNGTVTPADLGARLHDVPGDDAPDPDLRLANQIVARFGARIVQYTRPPTVPGRIY